MNVPEIRKLQRDIMEEPKRFAMHTWGTKLISKMEHFNNFSAYGALSEVKVRDDARLVPPCNTAVCMAGTVVFKAKPKTFMLIVKNTHVAEHARQILGITEDQARRLFFVDHWPKKFRKQFSKRTDVAKNPNPKLIRKNARVAVALLEEFIRCRGYLGE